MMTDCRCLGKGRVFCAGYDFSAGGGDFSSFGKATSATGENVGNILVPCVRA